MAYWQSYVRVLGKALSPKTYSNGWKNLEGKSWKDCYQTVKTGMDKLATEATIVHIGTPGKDSIRRPHFQSFATTLMIPTVVCWFVGRVYTRDPRCRKAAQVCASAYGQGGQYVSPVPK